MQIGLMEHAMSLRQGAVHALDVVLCCTCS